RGVYETELDLTLPLLMIALSLLAVDIWEFAEEVPAIVSRICKKSQSLFRKVKNPLYLLKNK
ncbi:MAG: hypothetical protein K2I35_08145, partial [Duncaniella sp.]|nr:hypothetical protein [Duncaniella sp.]